MILIHDGGMPSSDTLVTQHSNIPGRSRTKSAWGALIVLFFLASLSIFNPIILRTSVRALLWATRPLTGLKITSRRLEVAFGKPLRWDKVTIISGQTPYKSEYELKKISLTLTSPWRIFFGDHILIDSIEASGGKGFIDLRTQKNESSHFFSEQARKLFYSFFQKKIIPSALSLNDLSFVLMAKDQRYSISNFFFSNKNRNTLSYTAADIEAGSIRCHLPQASCEAFWDGKMMTLKKLPLTEGITLQNLQLMPEADGISFGLTSEIFEGIVRADGSLNRNPSGPRIEAALLGQKLPLERLAKFLGFTKKISGNLREGRLTFRGSPFNIMDAEASLRIIADNFRWEKRGRATLFTAANLIGRKISVTDFQLKQENNRIIASGEMTLPTLWHKIAQTPFTLKLKALIQDASQLGDLMGPSWNNITGKIFVDSEVQGSENIATGYLNAQGSAMTAYGLPLSSLKLQLLFQGDKTDLTNLDIWSGSDRLHLSGIVENHWPHHYEGKAEINSVNLARQLNLLGINESNLIHNGSLEASWNGSGTVTNQNGSFDLLLHQMTLASKQMSAHCKGSYTPEQLECPTFLVQENGNILNTSLTLSCQGITLNKLTLTRDQQTTLSGNIFLPINAETLFNKAPWSHTLISTTPLDVDLALHHLPLETFSTIFPDQSLSGLVDGKIQAKGLWKEPLVHLSLQCEKVLPSIISSGASRKNSRNSFSVAMTSEKGKATIDAAIFSTTEKKITLQGSFPLAPKFTDENSDHENILIGPTDAPLHLKLSIPQMGLDFFTSKVLPPEIIATESSVSGELSIEGTLSKPSFLGHLQLLAEKISLGSLLAPLRSAHAKFIFAPEKIMLTEASSMMGSGKLNISGSSTLHSWEKADHNYHLTGNQLMLYESTNAMAIGNADLTLHGDNNKGCLEGMINLTDITWNPKLSITPFLTPPGVIINKEPSSTSILITNKNQDFSTLNLLSLVREKYEALCHHNNGSEKEARDNKEKQKTLIAIHDGARQEIPSWRTDIVIKNSAKQSAFDETNLHLLGSIFSPTLEGSAKFNHLKIKFPQSDMTLLQGSLNFNATRPWSPEPDITAIGFLNGKKILAHVSSTQNKRPLFFESDLTMSQETLALLLAMPRESEQPTPGWIEELPFAMGQQWHEEPIAFPSFSISTPEPDEFDFGNHGISYYFELK
ncbi:MAG: hypothetical protein ACH346_04450 [Chthoniobacterales bacterium]